MLSEGQNQSEQFLLTVRPMAPTALDSISHNASLILMNKKKRLLTAPGGTLTAGMINLQQDSGSLLKITRFVHAYRKPNLKAQTTQPNSYTGNLNLMLCFICA